MELKLIHINWSLSGTQARRACDDFLLDVFGAQTAHEMLMGPERVGVGMGREESLLVVGNTMLIPIAAMDGATGADENIAKMLEFHARYGMWIGIALRVDDLAEADRWCRSLGFECKYQPGMQKIYFVLDRNATLGMRIEFLGIDLPNDPRILPDWDANWWRGQHPLGIEGLQSVGFSTESLDKAREIYTGKLGFREIGQRRLEEEKADCASFLMGDAIAEAMCPTTADSGLARHLRDVQGVYCITFKVKSLKAAADYLRTKGLRLIGDLTRRFMIDPDQAFSRRIYFAEERVPGDPRTDFGSLSGRN
jgi:catechol 2,3-dioxygenase-like lactoylglutathione lyase family enzyme